jgi:hypothetical protein
MPIVRKVFIELFVLAIAVALTAEIIKSWIPYLPSIWLVVLAHYTWEGLTWGPVLRWSRSIRSGLSPRRKNMSYAVVACLGAFLFTAYWWGLNRLLAPKIAAYEGAQKTETATQSPPTKPEEKQQPEQKDNAGTSGTPKSSTRSGESNPPQHDEAPRATPKVGAPPRPVTLHQLFQEDFQSQFRFGFVPRPINASDGREASAETALLIDTTAGVKFVAFYIPRSPLAYEACIFLANNIVDYGRIGLEIEHQGDSEPIYSKDFSFSGRIFIYHEDLFSPEQVGELHKIYKERKLILELRGQEYLQLEAALRLLDAAKPHHTAPH